MSDAPAFRTRSRSKQSGKTKARKKRPLKPSAPTRAPATWRKNETAKRSRKSRQLVRSTTFKYVDDGRAAYKTKEQRIAEAAEAAEAARRVNDLPLPYGELVVASLAKSFGRSPMGIENNIKADYHDCKVKRVAMKKAIQKLLNAGTIRNVAGRTHLVEMVPVVKVPQPPTGRNKRSKKAAATAVVVQAVQKQTCPSASAPPPQRSAGALVRQNSIPLATNTTVLPVFVDLARTGHVLQVGGETYDVSLNLIDKAKNHNKFYKLQIVELNDGSGCFVCSNWGRIGTGGQSQCKGPWDQDKAIKEMKKKYKSKAGVDFSARSNTAAVKGKYNMFAVKRRASETAKQFQARKNYSTAAFMIDRSGSMGCGLGGGGNRFSVVTEHLMHLLEGQKPELQFSVQTYDNVIDSWQDGKMMANTRKNQMNLRQWLSCHGPRGGTDMLKGINALMAVPRVEERFLLADGDTWPSSNRPIIVERAKISPVNTIGVGLRPGQSGYKLLSDIANASGGSKTFVEK